jgi:hypothetical protein
MRSALARRLPLLLSLFSCAHDFGPFEPPDAGGATENDAGDVTHQDVGEDGMTKGDGGSHDEDAGHDAP